MDVKRLLQKARRKVSPQNRIDDGRYGGCRAFGEDAAERESLRSLLARPFYWLGYVAALFLLVFLWSAEHVEGVSAPDVD